MEVEPGSGETRVLWLTAYRVSAAVEQQVVETLSRMSPEAKARQMYGVPMANRDYQDVHRSQDLAGLKADLNTGR